MTSFIVDAMLGKLALWLRLAGHDTIYSTEIHDDDLLDIAEREGRVLLTADAELHSRAQESGIESRLLRGNVDDRVAMVFKEFNIPPLIDPSESRCSKCNGVLEKIDESEKEKIRDLVHEQTFNHYDVFWLCRDCNGVYFQGGQWENIKEYMDRIRNLIDHEIN
ncbi:MAG: Mut7-C RNAse domain-containing protein [Candidatus Thorarchaeota archaeon]